MVNNIDDATLTGEQAEAQIIGFVKNLAEWANAKGEVVAFRDKEGKSLSVRLVAIDPQQEAAYHKLAAVLQKSTVSKGVTVHKAEGEKPLTLELMTDARAPEKLIEQALPLLREHTVQTIQQQIEDFKNAVERASDSKKAREQTDKLKFEISRSSRWSGRG